MEKDQIISWCLYVDRVDGDFSGKYSFIMSDYIKWGNEKNFCVYSCNICF